MALTKIIFSRKYIRDNCKVIEMNIFFGNSYVTIVFNEMNKIKRSHFVL